jgi:8-oxo-dGTP pyrophosphatase MutT (NUDIX family)
MDVKTEKARASIAIIKLLKEGETHVLMMQRSFNEKDPWSGHWSFPGGKIEKGESTLEASIRETLEEVGVVLDAEHLVQDLEIGKAGSAVGREIWVKPFVFEIDAEPKISLDSEEVFQTFWLKESDFLNDDLHGQFSVFKDKPEITFEGFTLPGDKGILWGFSYKVLKDLYS